MKIKKTSLIVCSVALGALAVSSAHAAHVLTVTPEAPGVVNTTQHRCVLVETFDLRVPGTTIGTYSPAYISQPDQYGGAGTPATRYLDLDADDPNGGTIDEVTLTLNQTESYFGLWWSAAHRGNTISFFLGDTEVDTFVTGDIFPLANADYYGHPVTGENDDEQYAFINFSGAEFNKIVFKQVGSGGFESDNHTVARPCSVPDGGSMLSVFSLALISLACGRRKLRA